MARVSGRDRLLSLLPADGGPVCILCLGAHSDDIEIGCGGTLLRILRTAPAATVHWYVLSAPGERKREAERSARQWLKKAKSSRIEVRQFRESYFPDQWREIKDAFEALRRGCEPDLVLTHWRDDRHQDHRVVSDLTWNTFRNHTILEYEIPKYDGDVGNPNVYVGLDEATTRRKVSAILRAFPSQANKHWFTEDTLLGLMRIRGMECGPRARFAEAFFGRKLVVPA